MTGLFKCALRTPGQEVVARDEPALDYSTTSLPFIFLCPRPQNCEHSNGTVPAWSAMNSTVTGCPFGSFWLMWKASILIP